MTQSFHLLVLALVGASCFFVEGSDVLSQKSGKALSLFNIIRFSNSPCAGTGNRNGTCYTEVECKEKNGVSAGTCAAGYGVCCTFSATCGQTSNENCTYFESSSTAAGACRLRICKCDDNVCQLRLDFNSFIIGGPVTASDIVGKATNGIVTSTGAKDVTLATRCVGDRFSVTNPGGSAPPTICGTNTGEHMYVDANDDCNELAFQLGAAASVNRQWSIKITQYACDYDNLAPDGCTQYHFGSNSGLLKTFNFDGGAHLANQEQKICIRQESGNCQTCYFLAMETDFRVSGISTKTTGFTASAPKSSQISFHRVKTRPSCCVSKTAAGATECCGYGKSGMGTNGYDCLAIPGALKQSDKLDPALGSQFCGAKLTTIDKGKLDKTICTKQRPFHITFRSDNYEHTLESKAKVDPGFRLVYSQKSC